MLRMEADEKKEYDTNSNAIYMKTDIHSHSTTMTEDSFALLQRIIGCK
jgi:hypothetical protein